MIDEILMIYAIVDDLLKAIGEAAQGVTAVNVV